MQTPDSEVIVRRFFQALQEMKVRGFIRGKQTFTTRYGINRWNLRTLEKEPHRDIFQPAWLEYLVRDYGISAHWLLTGDGKIFINEQTTKRRVELEAKRRKAIKEQLKREKEIARRRAEVEVRRARAAQLEAEKAKMRANEAKKAAEKAVSRANEASKRAQQKIEEAQKATEEAKRATKEILSSINTIGNGIN